MTKPATAMPTTAMPATATAATATAAPATTPAISIVVPVFNTAEYLPKCLNSLINQSLSEIEIICVNDGSADNSLAVLEEYAKKDPRIIVINQDYRGVSAARNAALQRARAPYIMSCDSDDYFDAKMCELMLATLLRENVDVVICGWKIIFAIPDELKQGVEEYLRLKYSGKQQITWDKIINKIYKREIISRHGIDFPDGLLFEDAYFNDAYMTVSDSIYYLHLPLYNYLRHEKSVMSESYKKKGTAADYMQIAFRSYDYLKAQGIFDEFKTFFWNRFIQYYAFTRDHLTGEDKQQANLTARKFVREHKEDLRGAEPQVRRHFLGMLYARYAFVEKIKGTAYQLYTRLSPSRRVQQSIEQFCWRIEDQQCQMDRALTDIDKLISNLKPADKPVE